MTRALWKAEIVIWIEHDPQDMELTDLAFQATDGIAYCSKMTTEIIENPDEDPDWDGTDFFTQGDDE